MKNLASVLRAVMAAPFLLTAAACGNGEMTAHDQTVIYSEVPEFLESWEAAGNEGRYDDLKPLYSPYTGFAWVEQGKIAYATAQDVAAGLDAAKSSGATVEMNLTSSNIKALAKDVASVAANYTLKINYPPDTSIESAGVFTGVVQRQETGWVFVQGHFSSPMPKQPAQDPAPAPEPAVEQAPAETPIPN